MKSIKNEEIVNEVINGVYDEVNSRVLGANKEGLAEYVDNLISRKQIDFNTVPIEWLVVNSIKSFHILDLLNKDCELSVSDCFVTEEEFEESTAMQFGVINPLIYMFAKDAALVDAKLVTPESRKAYEKELFKEKK